MNEIHETAIKSALVDQEVAGLDVVSDGEFRRASYWHAFVDQANENYFVEFIVPVITREDTRYYTLGTGGFWKRTKYSLSRAIITRNDAGHDTFNISEVIGAGAAAGVSNLYYPSRERTFSNTADRWGQNVGIDAGTFLFHEFWPDINHKLFHGKKTTP